MHIDHAEIANYAERKVNLQENKADKYRAQVQRLSERLDNHLAEHPDFALKRMMLAGSLANGTALRSIESIDVACYIDSGEAPHDIAALLNYLAEHLCQVFPSVNPERIKPQTYSVMITFFGYGLDVRVLPILYDDSAQWDGNLVSQEDGALLRTNIPLHIEFMRKRKDAQETHFVQVVRLVKSWVQNVESKCAKFSFKSFMVELILAYLCDQGMDFSDYPEALKEFFHYVARSNMRERIVFADYYDPLIVDPLPGPVQIIDPVNPKNNVGRLCANEEADAIVDAARVAEDEIDLAWSEPTKESTAYYWQKVFGSPFKG
jgi:tRNA nucleotidyltransferase (CCA-adding enzyme)